MCIEGFHFLAWLLTYGFQDTIFYSAELELKILYISAGQEAKGGNCNCLQLWILAFVFIFVFLVLWPSKTLQGPSYTILILGISDRTFMIFVLPFLHFLSNKPELLFLRS
jgi:hypothetical protein